MRSEIIWPDLSQMGRKKKETLVTKNKAKFLLLGSSKNCSLMFYSLDKLKPKTKNLQWRGGRGAITPPLFGRMPAHYYLPPTIRKPPTVLLPLLITKICFVGVNWKFDDFLGGTRKRFFRRGKKFSCPFFSKCIKKLKCHQ